MLIYWKTQFVNHGELNRRLIKLAYVLVVKFRSNPVHNPFSDSFKKRKILKNKDPCASVFIYQGDSTRFGQYNRLVTKASSFR